MKGNYISTSRNITYLGDNVVSLELQSNNGDWLPNRIRYLERFSYSNDDGKLKCDDCENIVTPGDFSKDSLQVRYPHVTLDTCLRFYDEMCDIFDIETSYIKVNKRINISMSLFMSNVNNTVDNQYPINLLEWKRKYLSSILKNLDNQPDFIKKYELNLFLENRLKKFYDKYFSLYDNLNVHIMKGNSIGGSPGAMWRFLNLTNKKYDLSIVVDIDEPWDWIAQFESFPGNENYAIMTTRQSDVWINESKLAINFATIIASHIVTRPCHFDYDIKLAMIGFIHYIINYQATISYDNPTRRITHYNHPLPEQPYGWGSKYPVYGFDEHFLSRMFVHSVDHNKILFHNLL
jgi:hypothetical protein